MEFGSRYARRAQGGGIINVVKKEKKRRVRLVKISSTARKSLSEKCGYKIHGCNIVI